jgi:predicted small secreted protein
MIKMGLRTTLLLLTCASLLACATKSVGKDIKAEGIVDTQANLEGYKTYGWLAGIGVLKDPEQRWKPVGFDADSEIRFLVDTQLRKRGLTPVEGTPDAYVAYMILAHTDLQAEQIETWFGDKADLSNREGGALIVVLLDAETQKVIWAGMAMAQARKDRTPEIAKARLAIAVDKIFSYYRSHE